MYIQYALCEGFPPLFISFVARSSIPSIYLLALGAAESRDGMTTNQRSRGGAVICLHTRNEKNGIYTNRHVYTLLYVLSNVLSV